MLLSPYFRRDLIRDNALLYPDNIRDQLAKEHFKLVPTCIASGIGIKNNESGSMIFDSLVLIISIIACLLPFSQSSGITYTASFPQIRPVSIQLLESRSDELYGVSNGSAIYVAFDIVYI